MFIYFIKNEENDFQKEYHELENKVEEKSIIISNNNLEMTNNINNKEFSEISAKDNIKKNLSNNRKWLKYNSFS